MPELTFAFKDVIWLIILALSIAGSYYKMKSEVRHLNDVKANKSDIDVVKDNIVGMKEELKEDIGKVQQGIARMEGKLKVLCSNKKNRGQSKD